MKLSETNGFRNLLKIYFYFYENRTKTFILDLIRNDHWLQKSKKKISLIGLNWNFNFIMFYNLLQNPSYWKNKTFSKICERELLYLCDKYQDSRTNLSVKLEKEINFFSWSGSFWFLGVKLPVGHVQYFVAE